MMNQKSLDNLRMAKPKKEGYGYRYSLPQSKIDELFTYLAEGMNLKKAADECKICFETARKYFREGDLRRGIKPLSFRLTIFQDKISEKYNVLLEERRIKMLSTVRKAIDLLSNRIESGDLLAKPNMNHLDKLMRLEVFLLGGVTQKEQETKMLTAEDISGGGDTQEG